MSTLITVTAKAALKMPTKWGNRIIRVQTIQTKMTGNIYFPAGWVANGLTQAQFNTDVAAFLTSETNVQNHLAGAVGLRNAAYLVIKTDLENIMAMVQAKASANTTIANTIILACGFFVKPVHASQKRQNAAYNTQVLGKVILTADGTGQHEWEQSKDMLTIIQLPSTTVSKTSVSGLLPGNTWYFRNKKVDTSKKTYNWSAWIQLVIGAGGRNLGGGSATNTSGNLPTQ